MVHLVVAYPVVVQHVVVQLVVVQHVLVQSLKAAPQQASPLQLHTNRQYRNSIDNLRIIPNLYLSVAGATLVANLICANSFWKFGSSFFAQHSTVSKI